MANRSKARGTRHEVRVRDFLIAEGFPAVRLAQSGTQDIGDIGGVPGWTIEAKSTRIAALASAMDEARVEAQHAGMPYFCVIKHRDRATVDRDYVILEAGVWVRVLRAMRS